MLLSIQIFELFKSKILNLFYELMIKTLRVSAHLTEYSLGMCIRYLLVTVIGLFSFAVSV